MKRSPGPTFWSAGRQKPITSTSSSVSRTRSLSRCPSSVRGRCSPGVSTRTSCASGWCTMPRMVCRVVCGLLEVIATFCADQRVGQRRLAGVGPADEAGEAGPELGAHDASSRWWRSGSVTGAVGAAAPPSGWSCSSQASARGPWRSGGGARPIRSAVSTQPGDLGPRRPGSGPGRGPWRAGRRRCRRPRPRASTSNSSPRSSMCRRGGHPDRAVVQLLDAAAAPGRTRRRSRRRSPRGCPRW